MSLRTALVASALLALGAPAFAQDAPAAPPAAEATSPEEAALMARGETFKGQMQAMVGELQAAAAAAGVDQAKRDADMDAIVARYQPEADAFAAELETFLNAEAAKAPDEATRAEMAVAVAQAVPAIRSIPAQVRAGMASQAAPEPTPAPR